MNIFCPFIIALTKLPDSRREGGLRNLFVIEPILLRAILRIDITSYVWEMNPLKFLTRREGERAASGGVEVNVGFRIKTAVASIRIHLNTNK